MCSVSVVSDYYRDRTMPQNWAYPSQPIGIPWPSAPPPPTPLPGPPQPYLPAIQQWDPEAKQLLREVLERLDKLDKRLGDIECHDESKAELKRQLGME